MPIIAYDLTRLFLGPLSIAPRGIDRIDFLVARHFFADAASANVGVLATPWGMRIFPAGQVRRGLAHLSALWGEHEQAADHPRLSWLEKRLAGGRIDPLWTGSGVLGRRQRAARMLRHLRATGLSWGGSVGSALPASSIYLNVGQIGLAVPAFHRWLERRPDVTAAFMLHDAIPLELPGQVEPSSVGHHARMMGTAARHAGALITTTRAAQRSIARAFARHGRSELPVLVRGLPVDDAFARSALPPPGLAGHDYFVVCSTVEPRKNHGLLLAVWRALVADRGERAPHLIIAGSRGWQADAILRQAQAPQLRSKVHHVPGLSTPALARLMRGARAVLSPTRAEGFGLPVLEACALGVPVIASDIPSHREILAGISHFTQARLIPPDDLRAWRDAIVGIPLRAQPDVAPPRIAPDLLGSAYCGDIEAFVHACARENAARRGVAC